MSKSPAWQRKEGKNPKGGLNAKGRASAKAEGSNLKPPQPEGGPRKKSFCARMQGMKNKLTSSETANDPNSRINKSLRVWKCADGGDVTVENALRMARNIGGPVMANQLRAAFNSPTPSNPMQDPGPQQPYYQSLVQSKEASQQYGMPAPQAPTSTPIRQPMGFAEGGGVEFNYGLNPNWGADLPQGRIQKQSPTRWEISGPGTFEAAQPYVHDSARVRDAENDRMVSNALREIQGTTPAVKPGMRTPSEPAPGIAGDAPAGTGATPVPAEMLAMPKWQERTNDFKPPVPSEFPSHGSTAMRAVNFEPEHYVSEDTTSDIMQQMQEHQPEAKGGAVWNKPRPKSLGKSEPLSSKQKSSAKAAAKAAGRPYPNLIDNMRAARKAEGGEVEGDVQFAPEEAMLPMRQAYGQRWNPETQKFDSPEQKSFGFQGPVKVGTRDVASEYSTSSDIGEHPSIVSGMPPHLSQEVWTAARMNQPLPEDVARFADKHAQQRLEEGKSPFWQFGHDKFPEYSLDQEWPAAATRAVRTSYPEVELENALRAARASQPKKEYKPFGVLPLREDEQGIHFDPYAGVLGTVTRPFKYFTETMTGEKPMDVTSPESVAAATDLAGAVTLGAGAFERPAGAIAAGASRPSPADNPLAKSGLFGKGWFFNKKDSQLHGIDPSDLGPHGDHDGWISIGDNAKKLGLDENEAKAFQTAVWGSQTDIPEKYKALEDEFYGKGYLKGEDEYYPDDELHSLYEQFFKEKFGMSPQKAKENATFEDLIRVRYIPKTQTLSFTKYGQDTGEPINKLIKYVDKMVKQDPSLLNDVKKVVYQDEKGDVHSVPFSEFLIGERKRFFEGGSVKVPEFHSKYAVMNNVNVDNALRAAKRK